LSTATGLSPGGSSTVNIYTQMVHRTTQITTNFEECRPCPVFASFTLTFALQLRKKHGKTSVRVRKTTMWTQFFFIFNLRTEAFKAYCAIWVRRSNFRHQASPCLSPRKSTQRWKVELWARNVRKFCLNTDFHVTF